MSWWICLFRPLASANATKGLHSIFCVRPLQVCSFNSDGQYQSLEKWDEQKVRLSRFFIQTKAKKRGALRQQKKRNNMSVHYCDEKADNAIKAMVAGCVGTAIIPAAVNWTVLATAMGAGCVAIGNAYGVTLTKEEGWKLVKQFILGAGTMFLALNIGSKVFAMIAQATGIGYVGGAALDGAISAAQAWSVGACAKEYFRRDYLGKTKPSKEELGRIFKETFKKHKR